MHVSRPCTNGGLVLPHAPLAAMLGPSSAGYKSQESDLVVVVKGLHTYIDNYRDKGFLPSVYWWIYFSPKLIDINRAGVMYPRTDSGRLEMTERSSDASVARFLPFFHFISQPPLLLDLVRRTFQAAAPSATLKPSS